MRISLESIMQPVYGFLKCRTPDSWIHEAAKSENLPALLVDHANCELKAAQTAIWLLRKYAVDPQEAARIVAWTKPYEDFVYRKQGNGVFPDKKAQFAQPVQPNQEPHSDAFVQKLVSLVKEELQHFEQVCDLMKARDIAYTDVSAARYAKGLMKCVRTYEPATLVDKLVIGAYIEARSCERFAALAPHLPSDLKRFYWRLLKSEARHFSDYLALAEMIAPDPLEVDERVEVVGAKEAELIQTSDTQFRFHSGAPVLVAA